MSFNKIREIPDHYKQMGPLDLWDNKITKIPDGFIQDGPLSLGLNRISEIPKNFVQNGDLNLSYNFELNKIPDNFIQNGTLSLSHNNITEIPKNFIQNGDLFLTDNLITKYPFFLKNNVFKIDLRRNPIENHFPSQIISFLIKVIEKILYKTNILAFCFKNGYYKNQAYRRIERYLWDLMIK